MTDGKEAGTGSADAPRQAPIQVEEFEGYCPICETEVRFRAESDKIIPKEWYGAWFRGALRCSECRSPPRERAIAHVLACLEPDWRSKVVHEASPGGWAFSRKLRAECARYVPSQFDPAMEPGAVHPRFGWRNENLERQTFADSAFDIVIAQDVFEHLFRPGQAAREIARTLRSDGLCLLTVPAVQRFGRSVRRAEETSAGVRHILPETYHGSPVGDGRSLVTVDWSYDIGAYLSAASRLPFVVMVLDDLSMGIRDAVNLVLAARKSPLPDLGERFDGAP